MANVTVTGPYPYPLGKLFPAGSFASISVPITTNVQPVKKDGQTGATLNDNMWNGVFLQAPKGNTGNIYVCSNASNPDTTNWTNVLAELQPGGTFSRGKEWAFRTDIGALFIGATNATDSAFGFIDSF